MRRTQKCFFFLIKFQIKNLKCLPMPIKKKDNKNLFKKKEVFFYYHFNFLTFK